MGWIMMSERELNRIEILSQVNDGRLGVMDGALLLGLSKRQIFRLLVGFREDGPSALRHKARGKAPNNIIHAAKRSADFGPTLASEMLLEHHAFKVSRKTLRKWMQEDGLWLFA